MARDRRVGRPPAAPGRGPRRPRATTPSSPQSPTIAADPRFEPPRPDAAPSPAARPGRATRRRRRPRVRFGLTGRAMIVFGVLGVLALSFASSLRVYLVQSNDLAVARSQISEHSARVEELEQELQRWEDPAYVVAQARTRLGWVMPGQVGYRVVDADGNVVSGSQEIEGVGRREGNYLEARWWDRLDTSLRAADEIEPEVEPEVESAP